MKGRSAREGEQDYSHHQPCGALGTFVSNLPVGSTWGIGTGSEVTGLLPTSLLVRASPDHVLSFPRKEVIQPQLPLQLPCYDFVPVTGPALERCLLAVSELASGVTSSHDVTGGVYKARERIHRTMADARLLATPTSCGRVAAHNPNCDRL